MATRSREASAGDEEAFEGLYAQLEETARRLEQGNLGLEESILLYERGAALVQRLRGILDDAESRVRQVRERLDGSRSELREAGPAPVEDQ